MTHPPAFVITLERNIQRGRRVQQHLAQHGIQAQIRLGVDGTQPIKLNPGEAIDREAFFINHLRPLQPTETGCYLAHYRLMQHALQQKWERILIFEDDTFPLPELKNLLPRILQLDTSHEYINLQPHILPQPLLNSQHQLTQPLDTNHLLVRTVKFCLGTRGYAVSRSGMQKMIPAMMPISSPIDEHIDHLIWEKNLRAFDIWPGILFHAGLNIIQNRNRGKFGLPQLTRNYIRKWLRGRVASHSRIVEQRKLKLQQYTQQCLLEHKAKPNGGGSGIRTREGA